MTFLPYRETLYRDWTIQHTWRTALDRPGPDGFDRVAVKAGQLVMQGEMTWQEFTGQLDALDGVGRSAKPPQPLQGARGTAAPPEPRKPPARRRRDPDPALQPLFHETT